MRFVLGLIGIAMSYVLVRYREPIGEMVGEPDWANKVGGIYNVLIICGVLGFFWSISYMTNTLDVFFAPILAIFPNNAATTGVQGSEF